MTEEEWLSDDASIELLLRRDGSALSNRKLRLLACATVSNIRDGIDNRLLESLQAIERYADGLITAEELATLERRAWEIENEYDRECDFESGPFGGDRNLDELLDRCIFHRSLARALASDASEGGVYESVIDCVVGVPISYAVRCTLIRDIFGNPFRPVTLDPRWQSSTVLDLARTIYDQRTFETMPILGDALMDAGCDSEEIIQHCQGPGPHVRGCWVVDLLLGKQ